MNQFAMSTWPWPRDRYIICALVFVLQQCLLLPAHCSVHLPGPDLGRVKQRLFAPQLEQVLRYSMLITNPKLDYLSAAPVRTCS